MEYEELAGLLANFDENQLRAIAGIAFEVAVVKARRSTGRTSFDLNHSDGVIGDVTTTKVRREKIKKKNS